jgi:hypothetical protein
MEINNDCSFLKNKAPKMKFEEVLKACAGGSLPKVRTTDGLEGHITVIKDHNNVRGVEVVIPSIPSYKGVRWYWDSDETDKRRNYMRDLMIIQ